MLKDTEDWVQSCWGFFHAFPICGLWKWDMIKGVEEIILLPATTCLQGQILPGVGRATFYLTFWSSIYFSSIQSLSHVWLFASPRTAARQASLSITNTWSLLKLMSIGSVMLSISSSVIPFYSHLQSFPSSGSFPKSQFFTSREQSIRVSASASVHPVNIQDWFPFRWTGCISLQSKGLSRVFSSTTFQKHQFFWAQLSL